MHAAKLRHEPSSHNMQHQRQEKRLRACRRLTALWDVHRLAGHVKEQHKKGANGESTIPL